MSERLRTGLRYGYLPIMLLGFNGAAYALVVNGQSLFWLAPLLAIAFVFAHVSEQTLPIFSEWNDVHDDRSTNAWHIAIYESGNVLGLALIPLVAWALQLKPGGLIGIWPREWPILAQWAMAILMADFAFTFIHFLSHRWSSLWRLHAVHHGSRRLTSWNGVVRHPLHQMLDMAIGTAPLALCGMPLEVATLLGFAISVQLIVQHSNVDYAAGPLKNHLSIGRIHHLHHVNWGTEGDCNFGLFLTIWDRMLGTFSPEPSRPITPTDMGIDEIPQFPNTYKEHLAFPFRYTPGRGYAARMARRELEAEVKA